MRILPLLIMIAISRGTTGEIKISLVRFSIRRRPRWPSQPEESCAHGAVCVSSRNLTLLTHRLLPIHQKVKAVFPRLFVSFKGLEDIVRGRKLSGVLACRTPKHSILQGFTRCLRWCKDRNETHGGLGSAGDDDLLSRLGLFQEPGDMSSRLLDGVCHAISLVRAQIEFNHYLR